MRKFALALMLLLSALSFNSQRADANGATVVFKQIRFSDYFINAAVRDKAFNSSKLFKVLPESSVNELLVARIDPLIYRWVYYYASQGDYVVLPLSGYEEITFSYYSSWRTIVGVNSEEQIIILLPEQPQQIYQQPIPDSGEKVEKLKQD